MSILNKPLVATPAPRRHRRWLMTCLLVPVALFLLLVLFTSLPNDLAFVQHFATPPAHFTYNGHHDYVSTVVWSPDGKRIASASGDHTVQVWDASNGAHVLTYHGHRSDVTALAWSPNGQYLASGGIDATVQVWKAASGQLVYTYRGHSDAIFSLAWSRDNQYLASASNDGSLQVWHALSGALLFSIQNPPSVRNHVAASWNAVAWSPNGRYLAAGGNGDVVLLDTRNGNTLGRYGYNGGTIHAIAWSPDSRFIAVGEADSTVLVWNTASGQNVYQYHGHSADVYALAWSPDGTRIASGSYDGTVQVWHALSGADASIYRGHADFYPGHFVSGAIVDTVAWSPDGTHIASGSSDATVQVWRVPPG